MSKRSYLLLPLCAVLAAACTSDGAIAPKPQSQKPVLTTLELSLGAGAFIAGTAQALKIDARDQFGARMLESGGGLWNTRATYVSSAPQIASVSSYGLVTAVAPGTAKITASLAVANVTASASMTVVVELPTATSITLTAQPNGRWTPSTVSVPTGAVVTWVVPNGVQIGVIWLNVWEPDPEKLDFVDGVATRTFSTAGRFYYGTGGGLMWYEQGGRVLVF